MSVGIFYCRILFLYNNVDANYIPGIKNIDGKIINDCIKAPSNAAWIMTGTDFYYFLFAFCWYYAENDKGVNVLMMMLSENHQHWVDTFDEVVTESSLYAALIGEHGVTSELRGCCV